MFSLYLLGEKPASIYLLFLVKSNWQVVANAAPCEAGLANVMLS